MTQPTTSPPFPAEEIRAWTPRWSPEQTDHTLAPLTVISDPDDHPAHTTTALAAHRPAHGDTAIHPTPLATAPAYLAHDVIRALGKHLPHPDTDPPWWISNADESWRVAAAWTRTLGIHHYIVCRAHRITGRHWEHLMALREHTRVHLTLIVSGPPPPALIDILAAVTHQVIDTFKEARQHRHAPPRHPAWSGYPWWQTAAPFPDDSDEPWYQLPPRPARPRSRPRAPTQSTQGHSNGPPPPEGSRSGPAAARPMTHAMSPQPGRQNTVAQRIHTRVAHPIHAAAVAIRTLTGHDTDQLPDLGVSTTRSRGQASLPDHVPDWAAVLVEAASTQTELQGYARPTRLFSLSPWDKRATEQAIQSCRLVAAPPVTHSTKRSRTRQPHRKDSP